MNEQDAEEREGMFAYLDALRESGMVNMFGAGPHLAQEFGLGQREAVKVLAEWMWTFSERHPRKR